MTAIKLDNNYNLDLWELHEINGALPFNDFLDCDILINKILDMFRNCGKHD